MFCKKCGNQLSEGTTFCNKCGFSMNQENATPNAQVPISGGAGAAMITKFRTKVNIKMIAIIVAVVAVIGLSIWGIGTKIKADNETAIITTMESYSKAISTLDFKGADTHCEPDSSNLVSSLLQDIPYGSSISGLLSSLGGAIEPMKFSLTPNGEIDIQKGIATVPVQIRLSVAEELIGESITFNKTGEVVLAKSDDKEWLIRSMEVLD